MKLEPPASHFLSSAQGWLELGNAAEAIKELDLIPPELQAHSDVMEIRWQSLAQMKRWRECADLGERLVKISPGKATGWIHRSYALHEMGSTEDALQLLLPALARFPESWLIRYNLACYYCKMKNPDQAIRFVEQACNLGDAADVKKMALRDSDLADIREKIAAISAGGFV